MADCNNCPSKNKCSSQQKENCGKEDFRFPQNALSEIKRVIPVISGKGWKILHYLHAGGVNET